MMRKYGLDEGRVYVETGTLLEPNNFIPSWVSANIKCSKTYFLTDVSLNRRLATKKRKKYRWPSGSCENAMMDGI